MKYDASFPCIEIPGGYLNAYHVSQWGISFVDLGSAGFLISTETFFDELMEKHSRPLLAVFVASGDIEAIRAEFDAIAQSRLNEWPRTLDLIQSAKVRRAN